MSEPIAWLGDDPLSEDELLERLEPGLAPARGAAPIPSFAWNAFAFALGRRLLAGYAQQSVAEAHVADICATALAMVASIKDLLAQGEEGYLAVASVHATLRPMTMLAHSDAAELLYRIYAWGTRRVARERRVHAALADLARAALDAHANLAGLAGADPDAARADERAAQLADARVVLAGRAATLVSGDA